MKNILLLLVLLSLACGTSKTTTDLETEDQDTKKPVCEVIAMDSADDSDAPNDPFTLIGARIEGDCLAVDVSYSGGCGRADFKMYGQTTINKMPPPIILLNISLDDKDNCRGIVEKTLYFDLLYVRQQGVKELSLQLKGFERNLSYQY